MEITLVSNFRRFIFGIGQKSKLGEFPSVLKTFKKKEGR